MKWIPSQPSKVFDVLYLIPTTNLNEGCTFLWLGSVVPRIIIMTSEKSPFAFCFPFLADV